MISRLSHIVNDSFLSVFRIDSPVSAVPCRSAGHGLGRPRRFPAIGTGTAAGAARSTMTSLPALAGVSFPFPPSIIRRTGRRRSSAPRAARPRGRPSTPCPVDDQPRRSAAWRHVGGDFTADQKHRLAGRSGQRGPKLEAVSAKRPARPSKRTLLGKKRHAGRLASLPRFHGPRIPAAFSTMQRGLFPANFGAIPGFWKSWNRHGTEPGRRFSSENDHPKKRHKPFIFKGLCLHFSRGDKILTCDLLNPIQTR